MQLLKLNICFCVALCLTVAISGCGGGGGGGDDNNNGDDTNTSPVAVAEASLSVANPDEEVSLDGTGSSDSDGKIVDYRWVQTRGTTVTLTDADKAGASFLAPAKDAREDLVFRLTVEDDDGSESANTVTVTVNARPLADAGENQFAYDGTEVTLAGTDSDSDGSVEYRQWEQTGGADVGELDDDATASVSFTTPASTGALTFRYTVTDNEGAQYSDTVSVYVSEVLFSDTFDSTDSLADNWDTEDETKIGSDWSVDEDDGELSQTANLVSQTASFEESFHLGTYAYLKTSAAFSGGTAFRFSVDIIPKENNDGSVEGNDVGIMFPFSDADNYLRLSMNSRYGFTRLEKRDATGFTTLAVNAIGYANNQRMTVMVEVVDDTVIVFVDGEPIFAETDLTLASGTIALYSQDKVRFDNVLIADNSSQPMIAIASPLAYSVALTPGDGNTLDADAVVLNIPEDGQVTVVLDEGSETQATAVNGSYSADFSSVADGEHEIAAILRDADDVEVARDTNALVGVGGDYIVTVGDSITNGSRDEDATNNASADGRIFAWQGFQAQLADDLTEFTGLPQIVFNEGIGGDQSSDLADGRIDSILERHPGANKVLVLIGTNNATNDATAGYEANVTTVANQAATDVDLVYIAQIAPIYDNTGTPETAYNNRIVDLNAIVLQITGDEDDPSDAIYPGPDFYAIFENTYDTLYNSDGLHPNDAGYQAMADAWFSVLTTTP